MSLVGKKIKVKLTEKAESEVFEVLDRFYEKRSMPDCKNEMVFLLKKGSGQIISLSYTELFQDSVRVELV